MGHVPGRRKDEGGGLRGKRPRLSIVPAAADAVMADSGLAGAVPVVPTPEQVACGRRYMAEFLKGLHSQPIGTLYVTDFRYRKRFTEQTRVCRMVEIAGAGD
jgi:hypothetical protein